MIILIISNALQVIILMEFILIYYNNEFKCIVKYNRYTSMLANYMEIKCQGYMFVNIEQNLPIKSFKCLLLLLLTGQAMPCKVGVQPIEWTKLLLCSVGDNLS